MTRRLQCLGQGTASHIATRKKPGVRCNVTTALHVNDVPPVVHLNQRAKHQTGTTSNPSAPAPIEAPEAVSLRPDTEVGVKRKRSRSDRLGLTNRGVSQFHYSPGAGLGGIGWWWISTRF